MANEANVTVGLSIVKGTMRFQPSASAFQANVTNESGPTPGLIVAGTTPTLVTFPNLVIPALCLVQNLDLVNFVEFGVLEYPHSGTPATFYPLLELQAGETYLWRLSRNLGTLYCQAHSAPVDVVVGGFSA